MNKKTTTKKDAKKIQKDLKCLGITDMNYTVEIYECLDGEWLIMVIPQKGRNIISRLVLTGVFDYVSQNDSIAYIGVYCGQPYIGIHKDGLTKTGALIF